MSFADDVACSTRVFGFECLSTQSIIWGDCAIVIGAIKQAQATIINTNSSVAVKLQQDMDQHLADWCDYEGGVNTSWSGEPGMEIYNVNIQLTYKENLQ